jgi:hypothetical protein
MVPMTTASYPIPKPLWDAIENVLMVKSKELIKDIASSLHQSEKPLLDAFKAKKHTFHLIETTEDLEEPHECKMLVCTHAIAHRCRKPTLLGKQVCPEHEFTKQPTLGTKPILKRIVTEEGETYFIDNIQNVYTVDFQVVGTYTEGTVTLFEIDEEEEYC